MGVVKQIISRIRKIGKYDPVQYIVMDDGSYQLRYIASGKKITYRSLDALVFETDPLMLLMQKAYRGRYDLPRTSLPSLTREIALESFVARAGVEEYDEAKRTWKSREPFSWTVSGAIDYTCIFHDDSTDTTIGMRRVTGRFQSYMAAKVDGKIVFGLPFNDVEICRGIIKGWEKVFLHESRLLDVRAYGIINKRMLPL
ncbi:MAG: hypothetical protein NDI94_03325 [Candidatus Woesearchaeota archaeon]|nr:hypothetical protein [Candidatus Woesearchaeota archaeon]